MVKDRILRLPVAVRGALELSRTRLEGCRAEARLRKGEVLTQSIIDSLRSAVAVIRPSGEIIQVNRTWREFAKGNGGSEATTTGVGLNYLDITSAALPDTTAAQTLAGIHAVLRSERPSFTLEYPCHSPETKRWFVLDATPLESSRAGLVIVHTDISTRKRAEEALAASEQRYRSLFEQSPIGIYRTTPDGRILLANAAILEMLGYASTEQLIARNLEEEGFQPDSPRARFKEILARDGEVRGLESSWMTSDGRKLLVIENARAIRAADGTVLHYEGTVEDITARKLAEEQAQTERARFRTLTESTPFGMRLTTAAGDVTYVNPAWVALFGYTLDESPTLAAWRAQAYPDAEYRAEVASLWESDRPARERGETVTRSVRVTCKDGNRKLVLMTSTTLEGGQILTSCEDITARAAAQEAQRRLATAVEQAAECMLITNRDGTIEYVNPAFERITGFAREEVVGRKPNILKSGKQDDAFYAELWRTITAGATWHGRLVNRRKDGTLYEEDGTITPIRDEHDRIKNFVAIKRDVTREVVLQQQLNQAQKMEAIGRLAGGIAHDFNNLLQAILSQVGMLHHALVPGAAIPQSVDELEQLVRRGAALTRQLLLFSRKETFQPRLVDLNDVVRGTANLLRRLVRENVMIVLGLTDASLPVRADPGQLDQVLMNLVVNASDAMPEAGRVILQTGGDGDSVWLKVVDTGHGIARATRAHLFEPFFTTKAQGQGTGLGLSVVHGIVSAHGGHVEVESTVGLGTTFTVVLPRCSETPATVPSSDRRSRLINLPPGQGETILIVEDEDDARLGLADILTMLSYCVTAVDSAEEALALPENLRFDLVLSDLLLPGLGGDKMVSLLEERWPGLRIVLMSGYAEDEAVRNLVARGVVNFLQKPFDMSTLAAAIRSALDEPRPRGRG